MSNKTYILNNKTVLGGGNNLKGLPPSATNFYGLSSRVKTVRIKALMGAPLKPTINVGTFFEFGVMDNKIFNLYGSQRVLISNSGSGTGKLGGFISINEPYNTPAYASLSHGGTFSVGDISTNTPALPPFDLSLTDVIWNRRGRYLLSKPLTSMEVSNVSYWNQLESMTISWIAGNNNNGGDKPDVGGFSTTNLGRYPILPVDPVDLSSNQLMAPPFRSGENLFVELLDANYNRLSKVDLWRTKDVTTQTIIDEAIEEGVSFAKFTPPFDSSGIGTVYEYPDDKFRTTTINGSEFGIDMSNVSYFAIRQPFSTGILDSYGVKYVNLKFNV